MNCFLSFTVGLLTYVSLSAQPKKQELILEVGKPCPDFTLLNIEYWPKKKATVKDFQGKWLVLDFWEKNCGACIGSFPYINKLQQEFGDKVQFLMVALEDQENMIRSVYCKFRKMENLQLPCAFDSVLHKKLDLYEYPYIIIIDDKGIIQGITYHFSADNIRDFLANKHPVLEKTNRGDEVDNEAVPYDHNKPFLIQGNGGKDTDFLFRSVLTEYKARVNDISTTDRFYESNVESGRFETLGTVDRLYNLVYTGKNIIRFDDSVYGKFYAYPVWETKDSSLAFNGKDPILFCYSLSVPSSRSSEEYLKQHMQRDLQNYFGYEVSVETRKMPCWKLVVNEDALKSPKTLGGTEFFKSWNGAGLIAKNWPIQRLIRTIYVSTGQHLILFNDTGIEGNIDIDLSNCLMSDMNSLKKNLQANGLDLIKGEKEMKVIVVRDPKPYSSLMK
jgi:thiol-disulfide isomerase/thioredoxin